MEFKLLDINDEDIVISIVKVFRNQDITREKAHSFLSHPSTLTWACVDNGTAVGYLMGYQTPRMDNGKDILNLYHMFVDPKWQRRGIASKLMSMALEYAREQDLHYVFLITQDDNVASNALYRKMGGYNHPHNKEIYYWYISDQDD